MQTELQQTQSWSRHDSLAPKYSPDTQVASLFIPMLRQRAKNFGITKLAGVLDKTPKVLGNELNPNCPEHKLGFETVVAMSEVLGDDSILHLWASHKGLVVFEPPKDKLVDDKELVVCMSSFTKEVGDVAGAIHTALEDLRITTCEVTQIELEVREAVESMFQLLHRVKELQEPTRN